MRKIVPALMTTRVIAFALVSLTAQIALTYSTSAQESVKIGILSDLSGPYAEIAGKPAIVAAKLAISDFGGNVLDRPIEMVSADHQNKADTGLAIAREWLDAARNASQKIACGRGCLAMLTRRRAQEGARWRPGAPHSCLTSVRFFPGSRLISDTSCRPMLRR